MVNRTTGGAASRDADPTPAEVRLALERILRSRCFEHAGRASDFLRFVVGKTLAGEADRLKGYAIAVDVFGRPPDFDAQSDPLVRVEALRLRQRLKEYYGGEGAAEPVRLELPRGSYAVKASYAGSASVLGGGSIEAPVARSAAASLPLGARTGWAAAALMLMAAIGALTLQHDPPAAANLASAVTPERAHLTKIAVVPFENLSGVPAFDRLAAGLTEEIMLRLDELNLFVIATHAAWYSRDKALAGVLGHEHTYVLTGSVRENAGGARITARIIEAATGAQIWSAAYDGPPGIENQPVLQAKVARDTAAAAGPFGPVFDAELALVRSEAHALELPDCQTRYRAFRRATNPALFPDAAACFQSLVERRPELAGAWAGLAMVTIDEHMFYSGGEGESPLDRSREPTRKALALEPNNVLANAALARAQFYGGDPAFVATAERTLALDPGNVEMMALMGILLTAYGNDARGLELLAHAEELSPNPRGPFHIARVFADLRAGKSCNAQAAAEKIQSPQWFITYALISAAAALCGDEQAAAAARGRLLALAPNFEAEGRELIGYWGFDPALKQALLTGLHRAGFELR
jgi:adenylate cyclase